MFGGLNILSVRTQGKIKLGSLLPCLGRPTAAEYANIASLEELRLKQNLRLSW